MGEESCCICGTTKIEGDYKKAKQYEPPNPKCACGERETTAHLSAAQLNPPPFTANAQAGAPQCTASKHTSEHHVSYTQPWFNGVCGCVCSADLYVVCMRLRSCLQSSSAGGGQCSQRGHVCVHVHPWIPLWHLVRLLDSKCCQEEGQQPPKQLLLQRQIQMTPRILLNPPSMPLAAAAWYISQADDLIASPRASSCERWAGILSIPAVMLSNNSLLSAGSQAVSFQILLNYRTDLRQWSRRRKSTTAPMMVSCSGISAVLKTKQSADSAGFNTPNRTIIWHKDSESLALPDKQSCSSPKI